MADELFSREKVEKVFDKYPQLEIVLSGGMVSKKLCRELLDIDKWLMDEIYKDLNNISEFIKIDDYIISKDEIVSIKKITKEENHD